MSLFAILLAAAGAICVIFGLVLVVRRMQFLRTAADADGVVVSHNQGVRTEQGQRKVLYSAVVQFATASGQTVQFTDETSTSSPRPRQGEKVAVKYDAQRPDKAIIGGWRVWLRPGGFVFGGVVIAAVGLVFL